MNRQGWSCDLTRSAINVSIQHSQSHTPGQDEGASCPHCAVCSHSRQEDLRGVSVAGKSLSLLQIFKVQNVLFFFNINCLKYYMTQYFPLWNNMQAEYTAWIKSSSLTQSTFYYATLILLLWILFGRFCLNLFSLLFLWCSLVIKIPKQIEIHKTKLQVSHFIPCNGRNIFSLKGTNIMQTWLDQFFVSELPKHEKGPSSTRLQAEG